MTRLTDPIIRKIEPPETGYSITWDSAVKGFGVRVTSGGAKSFILGYRANGRQRRMTIGQFPEWGASAARQHAAALKREVDAGGDPLGTLQTARDAETVKDLCDRFIEEHLPRKRPSTARDYKGVINRHILPALASLKVADVTHADVDRMHRKISKTTNTQANRAVAVLSKMMNLAIKWGIRTDNPAKGVEKNPEEKRERFLKPEELGRLLKALSDHPEQQTANAIRLLMLTGARRGEVLSATWDQFDFERAIWTKPSAHTKQKRVHIVPLSAPALKLLTDMKEKSDSDHLFPSREDGKHQVDLKASWRTILIAADLVDIIGYTKTKRGKPKPIYRNSVRVHDLRHTYASLLASDNYSLPLIGALLGHTQASTTQRYAHLMDDPLRKATERVGQMIMPTEDEETGEVVPLRQGR